MNAKLLSLSLSLSHTHTHIHIGNICKYQFCKKLGRSVRAQKNVPVLTIRVSFLLISAFRNMFNVDALLKKKRKCFDLKERKEKECVCVCEREGESVCVKEKKSV